MTFPDFDEEPMDANGHTSGDAKAAADNSDIALANEFVSRYGGRLRYVAKWGLWFTWDGMCWRADDTMQVWTWARHVAAEASEALREKGPNAAKEMGSHKRVAAIVSLARSYETVKASVDQWDRDPWALNTPAGIVDLRTGELGPHDPLAYCSKITSVAPADDVPDDCVFLSFVRRICGADLGLLQFLQRASGYSLTGSVREEAFFFPYGTGQNGKTKLMSALSGAIGNYHESAAMETFIYSKYGQHPTDLAKLRGARIVTAHETEEGRRWSESKIKAATGGDPISARFMRQDFFTFRPEFKLWVVGNHKPGLRNVDVAMRRRLNLVPFKVTIPEHERDRNLEEKLCAEWPFVLRWMIDGCLEWQRVGLDPPLAITAATNEYMAAEDTVQHWLDECCEVGNSYRESFAALWDSWKAWADRAGENFGTKKRFAQTLQDRQFVADRASRLRSYLGLMVRGGPSA